MKTSIQIDTQKKEKDYFPSLFSNKDNSVVILAESRTSDKSFSGMIIHSSNNIPKNIVGTYSTGWTYSQFTRLAKGTKITLNFEQED